MTAGQDQSASIGQGARATHLVWWPALGAASLALAAGTYSRADADLWGHVRYGLDMINRGGLTTVDPYSFTSDRLWINHEWLSEWQMGAAFWLGGVPGLALLKGVLVFLTFWLIWLELAGARLGARLAVVAVVALGTVHVSSTVRPQVWTFLAVALLCRALVNRRAASRRWLPILFAGWANLHGGWILGLGVLGSWAAVEAVGRGIARRTWMSVVPMCVMATLLNPYGWGLWNFMLRTVRPERSIDEWQPTFDAGWAVWVPWLVVVVASLWAVPRMGTRKWPTAAALLLLGWSSLEVMRVGSLFVEAAAILLAPAVIARWPATAGTRPVVRSRFEGAAAAYLFAWFGASATWVGSVSLACVPILGRGTPDLVPVHLLEGQPPGRLVTHFNWGQYAIWHLGPSIQVSMDGRRETVYSAARLAEHDEVVSGSPAGLALLGRWHAEYVWLPVTSVATWDWLAANGYRIEFASAQSFLAVRRDLPPLPPPGAPVSHGGCFPG